MSNIDEPIPEEFRFEMQEMAKYLDRYFNRLAFPKKVGFMLFMFAFEDSGTQVNYISNCDRDSAVEAIKEWLARQEQPR